MAFCHFYHLAIFTNQNRLLVYLPIRIGIEIIGIGIASVKIGIASKVMTTFLDQLHGYRTLSSSSKHDSIIIRSRRRRRIRRRKRKRRRRRERKRRKRKRKRKKENRKLKKKDRMNASDTQ